MTSFRGRVRRWREDKPGGLAVIDIPPELVAELGGRRQMRMTGSLNGVSFTGSTMLVAGGGFCVGVSRAALQASGLSVGDDVGVRLQRAEQGAACVTCWLAVAGDPGCSPRTRRVSAAKNPASSTRPRWPAVPPDTAGRGEPAAPGPGAVLVVGSGASGCQIAVELLPDTLTRRRRESRPPGPSAEQRRASTPPAVTVPTETAAGRS